MHTLQPARGGIRRGSGASEGEAGAHRHRDGAAKVELGGVVELVGVDLGDVDVAVGGGAEEAGDQDSNMLQKAGQL